MEKKRQSRIASFLGKEKEIAKMNIPPLSSSFLSASFINPDMIQGSEEEVMVNVVRTFGSMSIDMVEFEDQKAHGYLHFHKGKPKTIGPSLNFPLSLNYQMGNDQLATRCFRPRTLGIIFCNGIFLTK